MSNRCRLCEEVKELKLSHIIPKFFYDWIKKTSATGVLRSGLNINKREQDGLKLNWLCEDCEKIFSTWETYFSNKIFYPLIDGATLVRYNENFSKFCMSISWRVLKYFIEQDLIANYPEHIKEKANQALIVWKNCILGENNPGKFEQHFFNFSGTIEGNPEQMPQNLHRYFQRAVDMDVVHNGNTALVYSKFPNFLLIGYISLSNSSMWRETRVSMRSGSIKPMRFNFPTELWKFIQYKSQQVEKLNASMSNEQKNKIKESYKKDLDKAASSETFKAMEKDIQLFGIDEVLKKDINK